ncbi:MAG: DUF4367 domain-containing protein [Chloroflexi bacterium]|nr:DUF4367 domain-containing protein [Chloroflexota bacterium]
MASPARSLRELVLIVVPVLFVVGIIGAGLHFLNLVPLEVERIAAANSQPKSEPVSSQVTYDGIKQAEEALGIQILYPNYLPADLIWPPLLVSSDRLFPGLVNLVFVSADEQNSLLFQQMKVGDGATGQLPPPRERVLTTGKRQVSISGATAELMQGISDSGKPDVILEWSAGGYSFRLSSTYSEDETIKIAGSVPHP